MCGYNVVFHITPASFLYIVHRILLNCSQSVINSIRGWMKSRVYIFIHLFSLAQSDSLVFPLNKGVFEYECVCEIVLCVPVHMVPMCVSGCARVVLVCVCSAHTHTHPVS